MSFTLKGRLVDANNNDKPLSAYTIKIFDKNPIFGDDLVGNSVTLDDGTFRIDLPKESFKRPLEFWTSPNNEPELYLKVFDPNGNPNNQQLVIGTPFVPYNNPNEMNQCEAVVVGSGFGGTIISLSLVNQFQTEDQSKLDSQKRKVVILERGQWW